MLYNNQNHSTTYKKELDDQNFHNKKGQKRVSEKKNYFLNFSKITLFQFIDLTYFYIEHNNDIKHFYNKTGLSVKTIIKLIGYLES